MLLYVMRHGPAEDQASDGRDFNRRLSPDGYALVQVMAEALRKERGKPIPRILSSPRVRAVQTAEIVHAAIGVPEAQVELDDVLSGSRAIPRDLPEALAQAGVDVLLVGHQPSVEDLVRDLIRPDPLTIGGFHTATIVALAVSGARFRVCSVLDPRQVLP